MSGEVISTITVAELRFGVASLPRGKRRNRLHENLEMRVLPQFAGRVLAFDLVASQSYADLMAKARAAGCSIGGADGYIAATAAANRMAVATRDTVPFQAADVAVTVATVTLDGMHAICNNAVIASIFPIGIMTTLTVRNLPAEVHRALRVRAAQHGRSAEAEVRAILEEAVRPEGRMRLGSLLAEIGREAKLSDQEFAVFGRRDRNPRPPISFE